MADRVLRLVNNQVRVAVAGGPLVAALAGQAAAAAAQAYVDEAEAAAAAAQQNYEDALAIQALGDDAAAIAARAAKAQNLNDLADKEAATNNLLFLQSGTGAGSRSVRDKLRDTKDLGDFTGLQASIDGLTAGGAVLNLPVGTQTGTGTLTLKKAVNLAGKGTAHHAFYNAGTERGTVIERAAPAAGYAVEMESALNGYGGFGLRDLSIYHSGANTARAVLRVAGIQRPQLTNVEVATLDNAVADYGVLLEPAANGNLTLYGRFDSLYIAKDNGSKPNIGLGIYEDSNANVFCGGSIQGIVCALEMGGTTLSPINNAFVGVAFEGVYSASVEHEFVADGAGVLGTPGGACYVAKLIKINRALGLGFYSCYFELGGAPATYDDGVNGEHPLYPAISLEGPNVKNVTIDAVQTCYVYDKGAVGSHITYGSTGKVYDTREAPMLFLRKNSAQTVTSYTNVAILYNTQVVYRADAISYDDTTGIGTVHQSGVYRFDAALALDGFDAAGETFAYMRLATSAGVNMKGRNALVDGSTGGGIPVVFELSGAVYLDAGDTFTLQIFQSTGVDQDVTTDAEYNRLLVQKIS
ncbi:hypothetical protein [Brevundimonas viscosa]|uniref:Uncharacterized protein n=1 Tax=Brevundimonas viscosa TaxID=871741 RepID=A0A1I6PPK4_9CAUL|nr:hypothetical protein [Brevundimonas viscosa]SFS42127.1 hypothetical protein SAMN05192570_1157 [Brevundimonas viscosa]